MNTIGFFDNFGIQKYLQFKRRYFEPELIEESLYINPKYATTYSSILWCPEVNKYRLYTNVIHVACVLGKADEHFMLALAESDDCIHWQPFHAGDNENIGADIVYSGNDGSIHGATVMRDETEKDPARLYKCAASVDGMSKAAVFAPGIIATSPDGIHWNEENGKLRWGNSMSDSYNMLFYNPVIGKYQIVMRNVLTDRRVCTTTSADLVHWSKPELMLTPDPFDEGSCEFYGMSIFYKDGIFYGFLWVFETDMFDTVPWKVAGSEKSELVYSYDGLHWNRTHQLACMQRNIGEYGATDAYLFNICESKDKKEWFITGCYPRLEHGSSVSADRITRQVGSDLNATYTSRIKPGRFCGLESIGKGFLRLKKIYLKEASLSINVAVPYGEMRVQLTDQSYKPVPGFTFEDSIPFTGDDIAHVPSWKTKTVEDLKGRNFGVEIQLHTGCIFGITGDFYPFHAALPQKSYGDPANVVQEVFGTVDKIDYESVNLR